MPLPKDGRAFSELVDSNRVECVIAGAAGPGPGFA